jgi:hypothetical protein
MKLSEHDMLVTLATMALKMDDLTGHDVVEALRAHGYGDVVTEAREQSVETLDTYLKELEKSSAPTVPDEPFFRRLKPGSLCEFCERKRNEEHRKLCPKRLEIYRAALDTGCAPVWGDKGVLGRGKAWCCGCPDQRHRTDNQCLVLSFQSLAKPLFIGEPLP